MSSWRDIVSIQAQEDLDGLLEPALGFAQEMLEKYREFFPFAVVVDQSGEQGMVAGSAEIERPGSSDLIQLIIAGLVEQRSGLRAAAVVADVRLPELGSDAVRLTLEHSEGVSLEVMVPYRIRRFRRVVEFDDMMVSDAERTIWATDHTAS